MATVTITSTCNTSLTHTMTIENDRAGGLREPSFSSYLNGSEETFILKLAETARKPLPAGSPAVTNIIPQEQPVYSINVGRKKNDAGELSIFGAERYFNGGMEKDGNKATDNDRRKNQHKKVTMKSKFGTPSTCSEVSCNSQNALLSGFAATPNRQYRQNSIRFFSKCPCSNKKSVDIDAIVAESKPTSISKKQFNFGKTHNKALEKTPIELSVGLQQTQPQSWFKDEFESLCLGTNRKKDVALPNSNSGLEGIAVEEKPTTPMVELGIFGSPVVAKGGIDLNLQKKLTMLNWDVNPRIEDNPATYGTIDIEDDAKSDSSSDLFEIKSLSNNTNPFYKNQESDGYSSCLSPTSYYEPSEASIEWSVVTACAANVSAASDSEDQKQVKVTSADKTEINKQVPKRRTSTLLGCRSHKAVKVVAEAHKAIPEKVKSEPQRYPRSNSLKQTRFQSEAKVRI